jgi:hypothetical protein
LQQGITQFGFSSHNELFYFKGVFHKNHVWSRQFSKNAFGGVLGRNKGGNKRVYPKWWNFTTKQAPKFVPDMFIPPWLVGISLRRINHGSYRWTSSLQN